MSAKAMAWAWSQIAAGRVPGGPGAALVLLRLADRADPEGKCWPGHQRTAADLQVAQSTVRSAIRALESVGLLAVEAREVEGRNFSNLYFLAVDNLFPEPGDRVPDFGTRLPKKSSKRVPKSGTESKRGTSHKTLRTDAGVEPDNQDPEPKDQSNQRDELEAIRVELKLSKGQIGQLAAICKSQNCLLQDVHRAVGPHLRSKGLKGQDAFLYFKKCLVQNPGRDWTWEARRDAERKAEAEQASQESVARQRFIDRLALAGAGGLPVSNGGRVFYAPPEENPNVFLKYQKPDGASFLSRIADFLGAFPEFLEG